MAQKKKKCICCNFIYHVYWLNRIGIFNIQFITFLWDLLNFLPISVSLHDCSFICSFPCSLPLPLSWSSLLYLSIITSIIILPLFLCNSNDLPLNLIFFWISQPLIQWLLLSAWQIFSYMQSHILYRNNTQNGTLG